jgi:hypothetical protein
VPRSHEYAPAAGGIGIAGNSAAAASPATTWILEGCVSYGMSVCGWQDNGSSERAGTEGPLIDCGTIGTQRILVREDGRGVDRIVLSG